MFTDFTPLQRQALVAVSIAVLIAASVAATLAVLGPNGVA